MNIIVLAGMPASGKSTVAAKLSTAFSLPTLAKDELKESLFDTLGFSCYAEKRKPDHDMTREEFREKFEKRGMGGFRVRGARIDIDATEPAQIDMERLIADIREALK